MSKKNILFLLLLVFATKISFGQISGKILNYRAKDFSNITIIANDGKSYSVKQNGDFYLPNSKIGDTLYIFNKRFVINSPYMEVELYYDKENNTINIEPVIITGRFNTLNNEISIQNKSVKLFRGNSNGDVINGIPSISLNNIRNEAGAIDIGIRGIQGEGRVPILIDGGIQSVQTFRGYQGSSDRTYIESDLIKNIKIYKDNNFSSINQGVGGYVEVKTIDADDVIIEKKDHHGFLIKGTLYNNGVDPDAAKSYKLQEQHILRNRKENFLNGNMTFGYAYKNDNIKFLAAYNYHYNGNYFAGKRGYSKFYDKNGEPPVVNPEQEVVNTSYQSTSGLMKVDWKISNNHSIKLGYRYHDQKASEVMAVYWYKTKDEEGEHMSQWTPGSSVLHFATAEYNYKSNSPLLDLTATFFGNIGKYEQFNSFFFPTGGKFAAQYLHTFQDNRYGGKILNKTIFNLKDIPIKAIYGIDYQRERSYPIRPRIKYYGTARNAYKEDYSGFFSLQSFLLRDKLSISSDAKYTQSEIYDYFANNRFTYKSGIGISGKISYIPIKQLGFFFSASNLYRNPSLHESTISNQVFNYDKRYPLKPENMKNITGGIRIGFSQIMFQGDDFELGGSFFRKSSNNFINTIGIKNQLFVFTNYDRYLTQGIEADLKYNSSKVYLKGSATFYNKIEVRNNGEILQPNDFTWSLLPRMLPPKRSYYMEAGIYAFDKKLNLGGRLIYHSSKAYPQDWLIGTGATGIVEQIPPGKTIDLYGNYDLNKNLSFYFTISNLTNEYKYDVGSIISMPIPGRMLRLGFEAKF